MKRKIYVSICMCITLLIAVLGVCITKVNAEEISEDNTPPVITGTNEFTIPNTTVLSIEAIKNSLNISDDVDSSEDISIVVKYDLYSHNSSRPGTYQICFIATDTSGNSSEYSVKINVVDRNAPVFYNEYNSTLKKYQVIKSKDSVLVMSDIIGQLKAIDAVDGQVDIEVYSDKYTGNGDTEGCYLVILKAIDKSKNTSFLNVTVTVSSEMPSKTILIDNKLVLVDKNRHLTKNDFHNMMRLIGLYDQSTQSYTTINDDIYTLSSKIEGEYLVEYNVSTTSGVENNGVFNVRVVESRTNGAIKDEMPEQEESDGIVVSILKWVGNMFSSIFDFIGSLFS